MECRVKWDVKWNFEWNPKIPEPKMSAGHPLLGSGEFPPTGACSNEKARE